MDSISVSIVPNCTVKVTSAARIHAQLYVEYAKLLMQEVLINFHMDLSKTA